VNIEINIRVNVHENQIPGFEDDRPINQFSMAAFERNTKRLIDFVKPAIDQLESFDWQVEEYDCWTEDTEEPS
jgi:hypothetical protein